MRHLLLRFASWLNRKFNIIANEDDSLYYDWADQHLDGMTDLPYNEWLKNRSR